jgi:hypothetical protein
MSCELFVRSPFTLEADELFAIKFAAQAATLTFLDPIGFESFMLFL